MRSRAFLVGVISLGMAWSVSLEALAQDFRVEASVNANRLGMDVNLELTVTMFGDALGRAASPVLPRHDNFRVAGQSQSTSIQFVNGRMSSTRSITYRLVPRAEGNHVIGAISVSYEGKEYLTEPIEVEVVAGSVQPPRGRRGSGSRPFRDPYDIFPRFGRRQQQRQVPEGEVYVTADLSKRSVYVGEQVVLTYRLYTQVQNIGLEADHSTPLTGFWVEEVELPGNPEFRETTVEGKRFFFVEVKKAVLFPTKQGTATIDPATFSMAIRAPSADPFDSFFARGSEPIRRSTRPISIEVKPLPTEGKPRDFSGAVGKFQLAASLDRDKITAGEPLTLSVVLEGEGNLKTVVAPRLPPIVGFRTYDPKTEETVGTMSSGSSGDLRFGGEKRWEYVLVPDSAGRHQIASLRYTYFNPAEKRYVELEAGPLALDVAAGDVADGALFAGSRGAVKLLRSDVQYLKAAPGTFGLATAPFYRSLFFATSLALPILWNLALVAYLRKRESEAAQQGLWRARRAPKTARGRLKKAAKHAKALSKDFYEETAGALYRYAADKLGVSPSGLTPQGIDSMLEERQLPQEVRAEFLKTIESCEFARFTPGERTREEMETLLARAEAIIVALEKHFG